MNSKGRSLVVLSVPFARLTRLTMSKPVLDSFVGQCDIVVVSPLSDIAAFREGATQSGMRFLTWQAPAVGRFMRACGAVSDLLRRHGYWRRFRRRGLAHYFAISHLTFGPDGHDSLPAFRIRFAYFFASIIGLWSRAWVSVEKFIGKRMFASQQIVEVTKQYREVTLIQSANWGMQDRALAWMARREGWRTVLMPYATDQLLSSGYLLSDFDAVCVQGPLETRCAEDFHRLPDSRIVNLGSAWFRNLDLIASKLSSSLARRRPKQQKTILFAGLSRTFFPRESEFLGVETILAAIENGQLPETTLVYRPVVETEAERLQIEQRWHGRRHLTLQWPQTLLLGLENYDGGQVSKQLEEYVEQLLETDLIVMSLITSLFLDGAQLGVPSIAFLVDPSGTMTRRSINLMLDSQGRIVYFPPLPVVHQLPKLVPEISSLLTNSQRSRELARHLAGDWDYDSSDFSTKLLRSALGSNVDAVGR